MTAAERESRLTARIAYLERLLTFRDRQAKLSTKYWVRAAEKALAGDTRELRNRVEMAKSPPVDVVLSPALEQQR